MAAGAILAVVPWLKDYVLDMECLWEGKDKFMLRKLNSGLNS